MRTAGFAVSFQRRVLWTVTTTHGTPCGTRVTSSISFCPARNRGTVRKKTFPVRKGLVPSVEAENKGTGVDGRMGTVETVGTTSLCISGVATSLFRVAMSPREGPRVVCRRSEGVRC